MKQIFLTIMKTRCYVLAVFAFFAVACSHAAPKVSVLNNSEDLVHFEAEVVDPSCPLDGGLIMEPFKSGEGVFSNLEVSQASLMMVKGFVDTIQGSPSDLKVIIDDKTDTAKFFIKGYVTAYQKPEGMMNRFKKKPNVFATEGKLVDLDTGRVIIRFSSRVQSRQDKDFNDFASRSGKRLAEYLLGHDKENP